MSRALPQSALPEASVLFPVSQVAFERMAFINEGLAPFHVGCVFPPGFHTPATLGMCPFQSK